jgi:hypothetical protein
MTSHPQFPHFLSILDWSQLETPFVCSMWICSRNTVLSSRGVNNNNNNVCTVKRHHILSVKKALVKSALRGIAHHTMSCYFKTGRKPLNYSKRVITHIIWVCFLVVMTCSTGRFIMFSVITNIHNKKTPNAYTEPSTLLFSTSTAP